MDGDVCSRAVGSVFSHRDTLFLEKSEGQQNVAESTSADGPLVLPTGYFNNQSVWIRRQLPRLAATNPPKGLKRTCKEHYASI